MKIYSRGKHLNEYKKLVDTKNRILRIKEFKEIDENLDYTFSLINYILNDITVDQYLTGNINLKIDKSQLYLDLKKKYNGKKNGHKKEIEFIFENIKTRFDIK